MKKKKTIRLYQDLDCMYHIEGDQCDYYSTSDEISNTYPSNGSVFQIVVPGLNEWNRRFADATDFADTTTREDFDWAKWHRDGLMFAKEIQSQLPRDYTLLYCCPYEDRSGLVSDVDMETDDVDAIISGLHNDTDNKSEPVYADHLDFRLERAGDSLSASFRHGKKTTTMHFAWDKREMRHLRKWLEEIVRGERVAEHYKANSDGLIEMDFFPQRIGGLPEMGQFWIRRQEEFYPIFDAYINRREFVRTIYLSFLTKIGFDIFDSDDSIEDLSPSERFIKYYQPYNELKSDIVEWFITDELYYNKDMPTDEGMHCITEPLVIHNYLYRRAMVWNAKGKSCNTEDRHICLDHYSIDIEVPGLLDWATEYYVTNLEESIDGIENFEDFWNDGWILAKKLRRQLPAEVDLYYMCFDPGKPYEKTDNCSDLPKIIVPYTECDEEAEQLSRVYPKAEALTHFYSFETPEKVKKEAVGRMKSVIDYEPVIEVFMENDEVEIYEPPYGCSYLLDDEDMECVKFIQKKEQVLVWGIIRDDTDEPIDYYLFVSRNTINWDDERDALEDMETEAIMVTDRDTSNYVRKKITIAKSQAGTLKVEH